MMIYFIVFSETAGQLVAGFTGTAFGASWYTSKYFYVLILGVGLSSVVVKKELAELEWLSILLGVSILIFVILSLVSLLGVSHFPSATKPFEGVLWPEYKWTTISPLCTIMVAYSYQQNVFAIYDAL
jgi:amino acid permease